MSIEQGATVVRKSDGRRGTVIAIRERKAWGWGSGSTSPIVATVRWHPDERGRTMKSHINAARLRAVVELRREVIE